MTLYNKDQEYTLKVVNTAGETKEIKYTPTKDMSKPELIMALKSKYKNFFKLIESKQIDADEEEIKQVWKRAQKKNNVEWSELYKQEGVDTYVSYEEPYNGKPMTKAQWRTVYDKERENGDWDTFDDWWYDMTEKDKLIVKENKLIESNNINEAKINEPVIVISYGRGTRFPDRDTAIRYYEDCVAGTDRNSSENYSYQNILYSLKATDKPVVYDIDDDTEYDWWIQKGKPTEDISDELSKAHLGESKDMDEKEFKKEDLSNKDIQGLDEYTDNEIKKMYDAYCSENSECKSFEEWQKENVDSAMINELEYEFFSNRKKTESSDIDEKVVTDGFIGQPLSMLLTYIGDGHDIADKDYDSVVYFSSVDEIDDADNYDLYVQGLSQILKVAEPFDFNDVVIVVNLTDYVIANKDTLLDLFEVDGETDEEIMEDLVCRVMPKVISGYTTDNVYKILLSTVKGGK